MISSGRSVVAPQPFAAVEPDRVVAGAVGETVDVRIDADGDPELEIWAARRKGDLFEELSERKLRFAVDQVRDREERPRRSEPVRASISARTSGGSGATRRPTALRVVKS
jgi:hypothetical protein